MAYAPLDPHQLKHWWSHHSVAHHALAIQYVPTCASTNAQLYRSPSQHHTLLVAETQTHGRGQFERVWLSQSGDLIFSLGLRLPLALIEALSIRVGLAVARTCANLGVDVRLKWPNDVIARADGRAHGKLAGILVQAHPHIEANHRWVVIGVGVNVAARTINIVDNEPHSATTSAFPAIGLAQLDARWGAEQLSAHARGTLLMQLVDAILQQIECAQALPDADLAAQWNAFDVWQMQTVQWSAHDAMADAPEANYGRALGLNAHGAYCIAPVDHPNERIELTSGQIRRYNDNHP